MMAYQQNRGNRRRPQYPPCEPPKPVPAVPRVIRNAIDKAWDELPPGHRFLLYWSMWSAKTWETRSWEQKRYLTCSISMMFN